MQACLANGPEGLAQDAASTTEPVPTDWNTVHWGHVNRQVRNLRRRIFRASQAGDQKTVHRLQQLMLRSYSNRLQAVRRVTQENQGKDTPGVDKLLVKTPKARGKLVDELGSYQPWRALPAKRVYIPKANGKMRPLGIVSIRDRALQAMVKNVLEPAWEARFEPTSYGFRPGRSCHDAIVMIHKCARTGTNRTWVVDADITGAFDHISQAFLLEVIGPVPGRELIKQWLKAGYLDQGVYHPTPTGTGQGAVISPLLLNIALHGMEAALGIQWSVRGDGQRCNRTDRALVRYADDFVVLCRTREDAEATTGILREWLGTRGLTLSEEKTRIVHLTEGFDFLGFHVRRYRTSRRKRNEILLVKPSQESVQAFRNRLREEWFRLHGQNATTVVKRLNPIIKGWGNYFRVSNAGETFHDLDDWMFQREVRYAKRQHPQKGWTWQKQRYWGKLHPQRQDVWVFGDKDSGRYLWKLRWMTVLRHTLVDGWASPDDPRLSAYWEARAKSKLRFLTPSRKMVAYRQGGRCPVCHDHLMNGEELQTHHRTPTCHGGRDSYDNLALVHLYCHQQAHGNKA